MKNGTTFINKNTEYAISTESGFSGTFNIKDTKLITDSTDTNAESAVYIGQNKDVRLNVDDSILDMMNNSEISSSQVFLSNARNIVFNNSIINYGSKALYNFDAYSSAGTEAQNITFNNSKLTLTIPEGTHHVKKVLIFDISRRLVGINMRNDNIVFNNSVLKEDDHRKEFSNPKATLEFDYSKVSSNNSVLDIPTIGFDSNGKDDTRTFTPGLEINGASEVTIGKFNGLYNENPLEDPANLEESFKNIIINGGSVVLPMKKNSEGELVPDLPTQDRKTTTVINSGGELLKPFLIPKSKVEDNKYFTSSGNSGDYALSNSNYNVNTDKLQDNFAHIWYPPVTLEYFKTKSEKEKGEDGSDKSSLIEKIVLPKGTNIGIVDNPLPKGSSVIVEENIDSNKVGEQNAKIKITFENGSSVIVNQKVVVKDKVAQHIGGSSSSSSSSSGNSLTPGENITENNDSSNGGNTESGENTSNDNSSGNNSTSSEGGNTSNDNSSEINSSGGK